MARRRKGRPVHGWLIVDKPSGPTSTQVTSRARRLLDAQKVGHGGTLDPLATGILPIAFGEATKTVGYVMAGRKTYGFSLRWGQATSTDDAEGEVVAEQPGRPGRAAILAALPRFLGEIEQVPPAYSAVKVDGRRAYDLARAAADFDLAARRVRVDRFELVSQDGPDLASFEVDCGKGCYMRALARDLGAALGTAAHIVTLRRKAVGPFTEADAISLESLEGLGHSAAALEQLLPVEAALDDIPALALAETEASRLRCGQAVSLIARANRDRIRDLTQGAVVCAMSAGRPVALARFEAGALHPIRVLNL
jgi:tRNA pseudouridine55 synthase